jgi:hypothetical protein
MISVLSEYADDPGAVLPLDLEIDVVYAQIMHSVVI